MKLFTRRAFCGITLALTPILLQAGDRVMAITVDDLPVVATENTPQARRQVTLDLLATLARHEAPAIGFVNEYKLYKGDELQAAPVDLLRLWLAAGQELGNHSFAHRDFHQTPLTQYQADVLAGEEVTRELLAERGLAPRYYRHPYLRTGRDLKERTQFETFLTSNDYTIAPVTIDNSDWIFANAYLKAIKNSDAELAEKIGTDYVTYMLDVVQFYEGQSEALFERNIPHVLLLHANRINADWLDPLLKGLGERGYRFAPLDEVLQDPAYESEDTYTGPSGITWLHRWAMTAEVDPALFAGEPRVPPYVLELVGLAGSGY